MCLVFKSFKLFLEWRNLESQKLLDYFYSNLKHKLFFIPQLNVYPVQKNVVI